MKSISLCETNVPMNGKMEEEKKENTETGEVLKKPLDENGWQQNSVITSTTAEILENGECVSESREKKGPVKKELSNGDLKPSVKSEPVDVNGENSRTEQVVNSVNSAEISEISDGLSSTNCDSSLVKNKIKDEKNINSDILNRDISVVKKEENEEPTTTDICESDPVGPFDREGNKENRESDPTDTVFTVEDEEENSTEADKASNEEDFGIQVGECQSVPLQDENVSWGELQQAEDPKESEDGKVKEEDDDAAIKSDFDPEIAEAKESPLEEEEKSEELFEEEKTDITMEEEKPETYSYDESEQLAEAGNDLPDDQMEEILVAESQDDEDSTLAIQIDEDPIPEIKTDEDSASEGIAKDDSSRKRSVSEEREDSLTKVKRRKTDQETKTELVSFVDSADEDADDPAPFSNPPTPSEDSNSQGDLVKRRTLDGETDETENDEEKFRLETSDLEAKAEQGSEPKKKTNLEETIDMVATNTKPLPFLDKLRGSLKNLTRSDLEELIVQKLCEAITERSTVGELRRRAQALEQDQEKWKEKVQCLTKQLRESEMVMKKYMSEVQKQNQSKEKNNYQTPIRVTRSVGLQVSFLTNAKTMTRILPQGQNQGMVNISPQLAKQMAKVPLAKQPIQNSFNVAAQNMRKPPNAPTAVARTILSPQKNIVTVKKPIMQKPGTNLVAQNRPIAPQPLANNNRVQQQNQAQGIRPAFKVTTPQQQQQPQQQQLQPQQQQQQQQTGSRVIDLTDDDDRNAAQKALQTSPAMRGQVRVVNHLQQSPVNQNSRVFHLVPATTATTAMTGAGTQNRQIVIAASPIPPQNRQLVSSMPPLIFKGGNFVPAGPQTALVNQNVRPLAPKQFRHPAPLPQTPISHLQRPNWKLLPPRPTLKISRVQTGIVLSWNMNLGPEYEPIASYQLYAYQESNTPPATSLWKKVGDVKALPLPMACTLTQFMTGHKYHFAVRAVDVHSRLGPFSASNFISL